MLIETRGVGLGRAHFARRVDTHVIAAMAAVRQAAGQGSQLVAQVDQAGKAQAAAACSGQLVVNAWQTPSRRQMEFVDAATGAIRALDVRWQAAAPLDVRLARARPCGYLLGPGEAQAVNTLTALGVQVRPVANARQAWVLESYRIDEVTQQQRQDGRGAIEDGEPIRSWKLRPLPTAGDVPAGSHYVSLAQPLSALISAALEPDSQNSFAANGLLARDAGPGTPGTDLPGVRRVMAEPGTEAWRR
jgi:hypothetical protein